MYNKNINDKKECYCKSCNGKVGEYDKFCGKCGAKLRQNNLKQVTLDDVVYESKGSKGSLSTILILGVFIIIICILVASKIQERRIKEYGYQECVEEYITEFDNKYDYVLNYETLTYYDENYSKYPNAKKATIQYLDFDGDECTLSVYVAYDEAQKCWIVYNSLMEMPIHSPMLNW